MTHPERSPERDRAIVAMLPAVEELGWTRAALTATTGRDADLLFPGGTGDMIAAYSDLGDRWMMEDAGNANMAGLRLPGRVRAVIALRLQRNDAYRPAIRRALGWLALPANVAVAAGCTARTVDTVWHAAGDRSADFSWYTKRAILAGIYSATLLRWLTDDGPEAGDSLAFLDRRLAEVARLGRFRAAVTGRGRRVGSGPVPGGSGPQPT